MILLYTTPEQDKITRTGDDDEQPTEQRTFD